jgi:hypothetical protein
MGRNYATIQSGTSFQELFPTAPPADLLDGGWTITPTGDMFVVPTDGAYIVSYIIHLTNNVVRTVAAALRENNTTWIRETAIGRTTIDDATRPVANVQFVSLLELTAGTNLSLWVGSPTAAITNAIPAQSPLDPTINFVSRLHIFPIF